jgi:alpha-1,6-mannosyltransferase
LNPYEVVPAARPDDVSFPLVGEHWRNGTTVYGPLFTAGSEAAALLAGQSAVAAGLIFKTLSAFSIVGIVLIVAKLAPRGAFAAAFIGWNPVVAMQAGGSGHNDAIAAFALVSALALLSARREVVGPWAVLAAAFVKWTALVVAPPLAVDALARRSWRRLAAVAFGAAVLVVAATARYGADWLQTLVPFASVLTETGPGTSSMALWHRFTSVGIPDAVAMAIPVVVAGIAYTLVLRDAWRGRVRLGLAAGLFLVATPYLQPWYVLIPVSLAAAEEDRPAQLLALAFCAWGLNYLGDAGTVLSLFRS